MDGVYHLYNQQNPFENKWGHMSWGHATSTDLIHWKHLPVAIPEKIDKDTTWIFSGSAVWDKNNTSGFCKSGGCLVAIYTAHQPNLHKESQFIAYSNDGGLSYTNYEHNPVIDLNKQDFRDPNVTWNEQAKQWLMVVSVPAEHMVRFYGSPDLKNWSMLSEFGPQGFTGSNWECPFLIQLPVEGKATKKWVLVNSAAGSERGVFMQYFVGDFDGKAFKNDNPPDSILTLDYGDCFYAAIPWNDMPDNKKTFIGWMVPQQLETYPWKGQMSIPRDMSLRETSAGLRLVQQPSSIIKDQLAKLSGKPVVEMKDVKIGNQEIAIDKAPALQENSYWLNATLVVAPGSVAGFKIAEKSKGTGGVEIGYDEKKHELYVDKSNAVNGKINDKKVRQTIPLQNSSGSIQLEILLDKSSLEIFVNNGEKVLTTYIFPTDGENVLSAFSTGGSAVIKSLKIWDLSKIKD